MLLHQRYLQISSFILLILSITSSAATPFCSNLTAAGDEKTPCFLEPSTHDPVHLRSSGNSLILPCHVARSKETTVEWWYQDFQKSINIKIYPVFPPVRPTALRFVTGVSPASENGDETDIIDNSILLRAVNVDDKGIYRCVIRSWGSERLRETENNFEDTANLPALVYHVELTGARLCQQSLGSLPCFTSMLTSSPTLIDAYQTTFLQCVVRTSHRPATIFWVAGNASENSVLITDYLKTNQHAGDRLRRVFPQSPFDYSIELTINRDTPERTYSCVIEGATDAETTFFTYIVRAIKVDSKVTSEKTVKAHHNETVTIPEAETVTVSEPETVTASEAETQTEESPKEIERIPAHDALTPKQIDRLRQKTAHGAEKHKKKPKTKYDDTGDDEIFSELYAREAKAARR